MEKKFQIIRDFTQYDLVLSPIEDEMKKRGWVIIYGKASNYNIDPKVKGSLGCQTGKWIHNKPPIRPSFLIFHGVSFIKNWAQHYPNWDYIIVPSRFFEENLRGNLLGLGWSKADYYINNKNKQTEFKKFVRQRHRIDNDKPLVLFAPTYAREGGTKQLAGNADKLMDIVKLLPNHNIIFMPHEMCDYKNKYESYGLKVSSNYERKFDYLLGCDLMIGDISSLVFEFALLDKPIVLINNVKYHDYLKIAKKNMNESLDLGEIIPSNNLSNLRQAVDDSLADPYKFKDRRGYWVEKALGYCDGKSTQRIVDKIEEICG